jgi:site-specific DNA-methyltransferase (adenine-specific)
MSGDIEDWTDQIHQGDAFDVLNELPDESAHAVVCDPPYGLAFMGRSWDDFDPKEYQEWCEEWAGLALDVLKPGGHLLAFSGNRTHHRLFSGVEDAGFEIRDTVTWHYGSGFPKALDVGKAIDKDADAEREVVGEKLAPDGVPLKDRVRHSGEEYDTDSTDYGDCKRDVYERAPATDAAERWDGWRTTLKPASEFVVVARKPLSGTVAENIQQHGTGALNIDRCRIESDGTRETRDAGFIRRGRSDEEVFLGVDESGEKDGSYQTTEGRYPSNVVFDERAAAALDRDADTSVSAGGSDASPSSNGGMMADEHDRDYQTDPGYGDTGGPSRYFYTSKADRAERTLDGRIDNAHPTVKPGDLMEWLVKLVTAEDQLVVDPFAGSGTTCRAAKDLNRRFVGIEQQEQWVDVARVRCGLTPDDPATVRGDDGQTGLESYGATDGGEQ